MSHIGNAKKKKKMVIIMIKQPTDYGNLLSVVAIYIYVLPISFRNESFSNDKGLATIGLFEIYESLGEVTGTIRFGFRID